MGAAAGNRCFVEYVGAASSGDHSRRAQRARRTLRCNPLRVLPAVLPGRRDRPTTSRVRAVPPISRARVRPEAAPFALRALLPCRAGRSRDLTSPAHALAPPRPDERRRSTHRHDAARSPGMMRPTGAPGGPPPMGGAPPPAVGARPPGPPQMGAPLGMAPPRRWRAPRAWPLRRRWAPLPVSAPRDLPRWAVPRRLQMGGPPRPAAMAPPTAQMGAMSVGGAPPGPPGMCPRSPGHGRPASPDGPAPSRTSRPRSTGDGPPRHPPWAPRSGHGPGDGPRSSRAGSGSPSASHGRRGRYGEPSRDGSSRDGNISRGDGK